MFKKFTFLLYYSKYSKFTTVTSEKQLFKKEVLEKDALNRIKWGPLLKGKEREFEIHYLDREKKNGLAKINFSEVELEGDFF